MTVLPSGDIWPSDEFSSVVLEAFGIGKTIKALGIRVTGLPQLTEDGTDCWLLVKEFLATMSPWREALVKLSSAYTGSAETIYAPNTLAKVEDAQLGQPRVKIAPGLNAACEYRALAAARYLAWNGIKRLQVRTYTTRKPPATLPDRAETVTMGDGFSGVVLSREFERDRGAERLELRLLNLNYGLD